MVILSNGIVTAVIFSVALHTFCSNCLIDRVCLVVLIYDLVTKTYGPDRMSSSPSSFYRPSSLADRDGILYLEDPGCYLFLDRYHQLLLCSCAIESVHGLEIPKLEAENLSVHLLFWWLLVISPFWLASSSSVYTGERKGSRNYESCNCTRGLAHLSASY